MTDQDIMDELKRLETRKQELLRLSDLREQVTHLEKFQMLDFRVQLVLSEVAREYGITVKEMLSGSRKDRVVWPRMVCYTLLYELLSRSSQEVAEICGRKDHGSVLSGRASVRGRCGIYPQVSQRVTELKTRCRQALGLEAKEAA